MGSLAQEFVGLEAKAGWKSRMWSANRAAHPDKLLIRRDAAQAIKHISVFSARSAVLAACPGRPATTGSKISALKMISSQVREAAGGRGRAPGFGKGMGITRSLLSNRRSESCAAWTKNSLLHRGRAASLANQTLREASSKAVRVVVGPCTAVRSAGQLTRTSF